VAVSRRVALGGAVATALPLTLACSPAGPSRSAGNPLEAPPIDTSRVRSADVAAAWPQRTGFAADLDGDGPLEAVFLAADVERDAVGRPLWEDGHRWAVYVDVHAGRTLLYAAFVPQGHVEAAITAPFGDGTRHLHVEERTPGHVRVLEIAYDGPGRARLVSAERGPIARWFPDLRAPLDTTR
jgi:hypothetical protein